MPGFNETFDLSIEDVDLIEMALRDKKSELVSEALNAADGGEDVSEDEIVRQIHDLLGRLHNQKVFYRPSKGAYVGG